LAAYAHLSIGHYHPRLTLYSAKLLTHSNPVGTVEHHHSACYFSFYRRLHFCNFRPSNNHQLLIAVLTRATSSPHASTRAYEPTNGHLPPPVSAVIFAAMCSLRLRGTLGNEAQTFIICPNFKPHQRTSAMSACLQCLPARSVRPSPVSRCPPCSSIRLIRLFAVVSSS
jgi:hypothetical protein